MSDGWDGMGDGWVDKVNEQNGGAGERGNCAGQGRCVRACVISMASIA